MLVLFSGNSKIVTIRYTISGGSTISSEFQEGDGGIIGVDERRDL